MFRSEAQEQLAIDVWTHWKQRGKFRTIKEGDANTRFFHARASHRFRRNQVRKKAVDGEIIVAHDAKAATLHAFYHDLLGRAKPTSWKFDLAQLYHGSWHVDGPALTAPFEPTEIKASIDGMDRLSALGPNGLGPSFYRAAWPTVQLGMLRLYAAVHARNANLGAIKCAHVILLPKSEGILSPRSFLPVSL